MDAAGDHGPILVVDDDAALAEMLQLVPVSYTHLTLPTKA